MGACQHRQKMEINNTAEMIVGEEGAPLFLVTKARNQFLQYREMFPDKTLEQVWINKNAPNNYV